MEKPKTTILSSREQKKKQQSVNFNNFIKKRKTLKKIEKYFIEM